MIRVLGAKLRGARVSIEEYEGDEQVEVGDNSRRSSFRFADRRIDTESRVWAIAQWEKGESDSSGLARTKNETKMTATTKMMKTLSIPEI